jgi:hypothetical protein
MTKERQPVDDLIDALVWLRQMKQRKPSEWARLTRAECDRFAMSVQCTWGQYMQFVTASQPVTSPAGLSVAPRRNGQQVAQYWRFWSKGNDVYAKSPHFGGDGKISVHESGQIQYRFEKRHLQVIAPALAWGEGRWPHAFEIKFLIGGDTLLVPQKKFTKGTRYFNIEVPRNFVLLLNLVIGRDSDVDPSGLPDGLYGAKPIWITSLYDRRPAVLAARVIPMDPKNRAAMEEIRARPKANYAEAPDKAFMECMQTDWGPGGNVFVVVPMGAEAIRVRAKPDAQIQRTVSTICPNAEVQLTAPDGAVVAIAKIVGESRVSNVIKNDDTRIRLGEIHLSIFPDHLRFGEMFERPPARLPCALLIGAIQPKNWDYTLVVRFDGQRLVLEVRGASCGFTNAARTGNAEIGDDEELIVRAPCDAILLSASRETPEVVAALNASVVLQDKS